MLCADCALSGHGGVVPVKIRKIFKRGGAGFGAAGAFDGLDKLVHKLRVPTFQGGDPEAWVRNEARPAILELLGAKLWIATDTLIAVGGRLFYCGHDGLHGFDSRYGGAIGSGALPAMGALFASQGNEPKKRLRLALQAAELYGDGVRGPFRTILV